MRVRHEYMRSLLRQDIAFYDTHRGGEATSKLAETTLALSAGLEKFPQVAKSFCTLIVGFTIGFYTSWKLTLVMMACAPFFAIAIGILVASVSTGEAASQKAYARAGDVASEVYAMIRTVTAFSGERHEVSRYDKFLADAEKQGKKKGYGTGFAVGLMLFSMYTMYALSTYAGGQFILQSRADHPFCRNPAEATNSECFSGGKIVQTIVAGILVLIFDVLILIFCAVLLASVTLGAVGPAFGNVVAAQQAAAEIYEIIDTVPTVDAFAEGGHKGKIEGKIEFKNCTFSYPSRPDQIVLKNFSLTIEPGETVALVGPSGSGKSTIIGLIERFYDLVEGSVTVDGVEVKDWNLTALRDQIGLVQQEPQLFGASVIENIAMGAPEYRQGDVLTRKIEGKLEEDCVQAAKAANAHNFICKLAEGYHTLAGTSVSSVMLSGGQKQRICIARAIVKDPKILLLDEATSALDSESERIVQESLDNLVYKDQSHSCTTIMIAHRLSTVTNCDKIVVLEKGKIVEMGSHSELMAKEDGLYRAMRAIQDLAHQEQKAHVESALDESNDLKKAQSSVENEDSADKKSKKGGKDAKLNSEQLLLEEAKELPAVPISRIWDLQKENLPIIIVGCLGSLTSGTIQPIFALLYSSIIYTYFNPDDAALRSGINAYVGYFFLLGTCALLAALTRVSIFVGLGEQLTRKLRFLSFRSSLRQTMSFFDDPKNSVGRLTTRLASDATLVKGATGDSLGLMLEGFSSLVTALIIGYTASWRLALILTAIFPLLIAGSVFEFKRFTRQTKTANKSTERGGEILGDAVTAIRTVSAFNLQQDMVTLFDDSLVQPLEEGKRRAMIQGIGAGFKQFVLMNAYALTFWSGSEFIKKGQLDFKSMMRVFLGFTVASEGIGRITGSMPDNVKAQAAARSIFYLIDSSKEGTDVDPMDDENGTKPDKPISGNIEFRGVSFSYPSHPELKVLKDFSLQIENGQTVALVGESGSGKSTVIQLVQRFYDSTSGDILIDGKSIREFNVTWLRSNMGLVQQEPLLFNDSVQYNIGYGTRSTVKPESDRGAPPDKQVAAEPRKSCFRRNAQTGEADARHDPSTWAQANEEEIQAAKDANAYEFISGFQHTFATHCGSRGSQLSGGQKQRVAIARAVIRKPHIMLLDEATSALDSKSEAVVQEALDKICSSGTESMTAKPTTLVIAHRLSTIRNADKIVVLERGHIVEVGTHNELMQRPDGAYRKLAMVQVSGE
eukprot:270770-Hanusia_phi.AAC.2